MIIYLDVFFLINLVMDLFILLITAQTLKINLNFKYGILACSLGSLYALISVIPKLHFYTSVPFVILVAFLIVVLSFRKKDFLFNIKATLVYMLYSMLIGGMYFFIEFSNTPKSVKMFTIDLSLKKIIICLIILYIIINRLVIYVRDRKDLSQLIFDIDIFFNGCTKRVKAFLDTGNELREPVTNLPVLIVEKDVFYDINLSKQDKFYIPYKVINGSSDNLIGFMPNYIAIYTQSSIQKRNVIIAFCDNKLSNLKEFDALLSRGIL